ncbi:uncharacterized protein A4U43_C06F11670 [Asparagus officinalis]|uniref:Uncharacterized protein n=1 Tax=Asparagus officinalis TaxID=4686 RepID=A0A5P1EQC5_ASPOF|nr:uncharacterized protein A4U43_C06F11670 [Asparagus officinalis]
MSFGDCLNELMGSGEKYDERRKKVKEIAEMAMNAMSFNIETTRTILQVTQGKVEGDPDPCIISIEDNDRIVTTITGNKLRSIYLLRGVGARRCRYTSLSTACMVAPSTSMRPMTPTSVPSSFIQPLVVFLGLELINRATCYLVGKIDQTLYRQVTTKLLSILPQSQLEIVLPHIIPSLYDMIPDDLFMEIVP